MCLAPPAAAQGTDFGLAGGINLSEINVSGDESLNVAIRSDWGPAAGVFVARRARAVVIEFHGQVSVKGGDLRTDAGLEHFRLAYIDVPMIFRVLGPRSDNGIQLQLLGGVYGSYLMDATRTLVSGDRLDVDDAFNSWDYGWLGGVGVGFGRAHVDFRYAGGIPNISENSDLAGAVTPGSNKFRNRTFSLVAMYRF